MYDTKTIHKFKPVAFDIPTDKRMSDLTDEEAKQALENWIRAQFGHMGEYYQPLLSLLLNRLDETREELEEVKNTLTITQNIPFV